MVDVVREKSEIIPRVLLFRDKNHGCSLQPTRCGCKNGSSERSPNSLTALHRPEVNHNPTSKNLLYAAARELSRRIMGEEAGDDTIVYKTQQKFSKVHRPATATPMAVDG
ncbi:hypothetical protein HanPI659440_Chr07g0260201 [Helianthus annuus]|nr:hypothetical protein HanPI659440_Chr07g0260201 [Helianthus annuus]